MKLCELYKKGENNRVQCSACCHKCIIEQGKIGICGVRKNFAGELYCMVYGKIASIGLDPIEKKPLLHFMPNTKAFSIGTVGCNFKCPFCQNFDISQASKTDFEKGTKGEVFGKERTPENIVNEAFYTGCKSIAYTYNEPAIFVEFVRDCSRLAHKKGLKNVLVSNGYFTRESFNYLMKEKLIDAINIDLKSFSEDTYEKFCGAKLSWVLENIKWFYEAGVHLEITTLIIPGINDSEKELGKIASFIYSLDKKGNIPWHISRFFPMYKFSDPSRYEPTPIETLKKAEKIGRKVGLKNIHLGNV